MFYHMTAIYFIYGFIIKWQFIRTTHKVNTRKRADVTCQVT